MRPKIRRIRKKQHESVILLEQLKTSRRFIFQARSKNVKEYLRLYYPTKISN